ncbi:MAG: energy-coupling factor ABC transporter permease [Candidatus Bathyarchaeales archaeon]
MHIPDGFLTPATCIIMYVVSAAFLVWSWKKVKENYSRTFVSLIAISSAFIFAAQMINFPIVYGTSGHLVGGTLLAILLGPHAAILSMTIVLMIQAIFFADGGIFTFGANVFNMAVIGGLSFYIVKILSNSANSRKRMLMSVFIASWLSVVLGSLTCALQIGISPMFASAGGIIVTVPSMLFWHMIIGIGEAAITTSLISQLQRLQPTALNGLATLRREVL